MLQSNIQKQKQEPSRIASSPFFSIMSHEIICSPWTSQKAGHRPPCMLYFSKGWCLHNTTHARCIAKMHCNRHHKFDRACHSPTISSIQPSRQFRRTLQTRRPLKLEVRVSTGALHFLVGVSRLCTCSPSSGFYWNETGENWKQFIIILFII